MRVILRSMKCKEWMGAMDHVKNHPFPSPSFRAALSKPKNLSYFPPKNSENRPRLRTERLDSWVSKIARLREDTAQNATRKVLANVLTFSSYGPPKTPSPRFFHFDFFDFLVRRNLNIRNALQSISTVVRTDFVRRPCTAARSLFVNLATTESALSAVFDSQKQELCGPDLRGREG